MIILIEACLQNECYVNHSDVLQLNKYVRIEDSEVLLSKWWLKEESSSKVLKEIAAAFKTYLKPASFPGNSSNKGICVKILSSYHHEFKQKMAHVQ